MNLFALLALLKEPMNIAVFAITFAVLCGALIAVSFFVRSKKFEQLKAWGELVVASIEQTAAATPGYRKKELAMIALRALNSKLGARASDEELEMILEANVFLMKKAAALTPGAGDDVFVETVTGGILD